MMKRTVMIIISSVLCAGLILGLSACTIDIKTGGKNGQTYTIDLGDIDLEQISSDISDALENIDLEGIAEGMKERGQEFSEAIDAILSQAGEELSDSSGQSSGDSGNDEDKPGGIDLILPDHDTLQDMADNYAQADDQEKEEALDMLQDILESNGLGDYYDMIADQIENNPEMIESFLNSGAFNDIMGGLFAASMGGENSSADEAQAQEEPETVKEDTGNISAFQMN